MGVIWITFTYFKEATLINRTNKVVRPCHPIVNQAIHDSLTHIIVDRIINNCLITHDPEEPPWEE